MYLDLLEGRGINIKELAAEYLGKKLHQPKNMMYVKMMNSGKSDDIYYFDVTSITKDNRLETMRHCFNDFGYANSYEVGDVLQGYFDPEWFSIVYREVKALFPTTADECIDKARVVLASSKDNEEAECRSEYMEECKKAQEKLDEKISVLRNNYNSNFSLLNDLYISFLSESKHQM